MSAEGRGGTIKAHMSFICHPLTREKETKNSNLCDEKKSWKLAWEIVDGLVSGTLRFEDSTLSTFGVTVPSSCH